MCLIIKDLHDILEEYKCCNLESVKDNNSDLIDSLARNRKLESKINEMERAFMEYRTAMQKKLLGSQTMM